MRFGRTVVLVLAALSTAAPAALRGVAGAQQLDVLSLSRHSQLVFLGTVIKVGAATETVVPADKLTAIVRVDQVLFPPKAIGDIVQGKRVTVQMKLPAKRGDLAIWFTTSWFYGNSLGVVEVGRADVQQAGTLPGRIAAAEKRLADEKLSVRLVRAQLVVLGTVLEVAPAVPPGERKGPFSEHDPDWWVARIAVEKVLKGDRPQELKVLFAKSTDVMWIASPKPAKGETAIFVCQRDQQEEGMPASRRPDWTALDPLDVLPPGEMERVQRLIQNPLLPPGQETGS